MSRLLLVSLVAITLVGCANRNSTYWGQVANGTAQEISK